MFMKRSDLRMRLSEAGFLLALLTGPVYAGDFSLQAAQKALALPERLAHVTDTNWAGQDPSPQFILLQDVHKHPEVQSHIASVILLGYHHWGARKVFLEGAFSNVDVSVFENVTGPAREPLLSRLLQQGDLSGPELAAILLSDDAAADPAASPFQLIGMEDPAVYRENLIFYRRVQRQRADALRAFQFTYQTENFWGRSPALDRLLLLLQLKMTPGDYETYWKERKSDARYVALSRYREPAEKFYELVHIRSHIFLDRASREVPAWTGPRMVVVGGFHTAVMAEEMRKQGRSFVVLTPTITESGYEPLYQKHLMENVSALLPPNDN
jgi:hypothetical protein